MDQEQLYERLDQSREKLLTVLEQLPDDAFSIPNVVNGWSLLDILALISMWEAELVTGLAQLDAGKTPGRLLAAVAEPEQYNQRCVAGNQGRDIDRVFDDLQNARTHLERWIAEFSDRQLRQSNQFKSLKGRPLWQLIAECSFLNEERYLSGIVDFIRQYSADPSRLIRIDSVIKNQRLE